MVYQKLLDNAHRFLCCPQAHEAIRIIAELHKAGFVAYLAGGCVRDALLGHAPKDYDVATDATPESIREVFGRSQTLAFGASFGVIGVLPPREAGSDKPGELTEVATFRSDGYYSDGRRPDSVHFGDAKHDAMRRDFTINGLFYDPLEDKVIDYVGGQEDLEARILRTIGDPVERFGEDKLRMLRAVRFATTTELTIDPATREAIIQHADDISAVSGERIGAEMRRVLVHPRAVVGLHFLAYCGLHHAVLPEMEDLDFGEIEQLDDHVKDRDFALSLAILITAIGHTKAVPTALSHRWKLSNEEVRKANAALKHWSTIAHGNELPWSTVQPVLMNRDIETILGLASAIVGSTGADPAGIDLAREALSWSAEKLNPTPLLTGDDLRELGLPPGPDFARILREVRQAQLDDVIQTREQAIAMAKH